MEYFWVSNDTVHSSDQMPPFFNNMESNSSDTSNYTIDVFTADNYTDFNRSSTVNNKTYTDEGFPDYLTVMSDSSKKEVIVYIILFVIAAVGNLSVFISVMHQYKKAKSRIFLLILHLSIADLTVTFFAIPLEVIWRIAIMWYSTNFVCKVCKFMHAFGLYLSSMVLICISVDRYIAIIHPLRVADASRRGRCMLVVAWIVAALAAVPQTLIYRVLPHPQYPSFYQCVSFEFFANTTEEILYNVFSLSILYFLPFLVIFFTYGRILWKISSKSRQYQESSKGSQDGQEESGKILLRRNDATNHMETAKTRTLRLTVLIIIIFFLCWTPYVVMTLWWVIDFESANKQVDASIQGFLFIMAVANSCLNPVVYGTHNEHCQQYLQRLLPPFCRKICCCRKEVDQPPRSPHSLSVSHRGSCCRNSLKKCQLCAKASIMYKSSPSPLPLQRNKSKHLHIPTPQVHRHLQVSASLKESSPNETPRSELPASLQTNYGSSLSSPIQPKNESMDSESDDNFVDASNNFCDNPSNSVSSKNILRENTNNHTSGSESAPHKINVTVNYDEHNTRSHNGLPISTVPTIKICSIQRGSKNVDVHDV